MPLNINYNLLPIAFGFESAHKEWLKQGGSQFREKFLHGVQPGFYKTDYWKLVRSAILQRDGHCCCRCGVQAEQVHHLHYNHRGHDHFYPESMVSVCRGCHCLAEYVRLAESLLAKFNYRLSCVKKHLAHEVGYASETPTKTLSRLFEYRAELIDLQNRYRSNTPYANAKLTPVEVKEFDKHYEINKTYFQNEAQKNVDSWVGTDEEKSKQIVDMILEDSKKCSDFISGFFGKIQ